jgi:hypothetical protein
MRQLLVSDLTAPVFTNGVLAAGAVTAVIKTASGFTQLAPGDTYSTSREIQFIQGTPQGVNIFSPWIDGKDIFSWAGQNYAAQTAQVSTLTFATNLTVAGTVTVKFTEVNNGVEQFRRKSYVIPHAAGATPATIATAVFNAINADLPSWIASATNAVPGQVVVTGSVFSIVNSTELASFSTASEGLDGSNGMTLAVTATASPSKGSGVADVMFEYEDSLKGYKSFTNRLMQPLPPPSYIDIATPATYDLYSIQWLNPQVGQIKGVDNRRTLTIAMEDGLGVNAVQNAFQTALNGYLASVPGAFAAVSI